MFNHNAEYNSVVVCPTEINYKGQLTKVLDMPFPAKFLEASQELIDKVTTGEQGVDDESLPVLHDIGGKKYLTIGDYEKHGGFEFPRSVDGRYIALFVALSDVNNELTNFKNLLRDCGVTLGGTDYTQDTDNLAWLLLIHEFINEFKPVSPLFKQAGEEV